MIRIFHTRHLLARSKEREAQALAWALDAEHLISRQERIIQSLKRGLDYQRRRACVAEERAANPARELARIGARKKRAVIIGKAKGMLPQAWAGVA